MNSKKTAILFVLAVVLSLSTGSLCPARPEATTEQLPNRLKLLVFEDHSVPAVTMQLLVAAGSSMDPSGMGGLANLTARSLFLGTSDYSFDRLNDKLDYLGATYGAECTRDFVLIGMQVLKKDLDVGAGLFARIVEHPSFPAADVGLEKAEILGRLREEEDDPLKTANRAFDKELFRQGPYAGSVLGGKKSLETISSGAVSIFYSSYYRPNNAILVIGGDITPAEVNAKIVPMLLGWKAEPVQGPIFPTSLPKGAPVEVAIDKPVSQAVVLVGCAAMARTSADYYPFLVLTQILDSGDLSSRLMSDIGAKRGLVYSVKSRLAAYKNGGAFRVFLRTDNSSAKEAAALLREELQTLRRKPVSDAELNAAKAFLVGNFPLRYSLPINFARFLAGSDFYGLGPDYVEKYPASIEAVTPSDIQRVAAKYLALPNVVVIVGDLKKMPSR
ncbi:MAG: pitrilysin family protein [Syntrophobacteraceae bacterium]|nr:pitrilysin family protein [Syntrophobacteraceae bacterium]